MQSKKDDSFPFQRNNFATGSNSSAGSASTSSSVQNCRRKLQYNFDDSDKSKSDSSRSSDRDRSVLSVLNLNDTRRVLRNGAEKITKTFNSVRTTLGTITQKFRISTKRRQILEEGPMTPAATMTPHTFSKQILGRTPTKLYSPFGIESPYQSTTYNKENDPSLTSKQTALVR